MRAIIATAMLAALGGCATFGGNVKGRFSCAAPDGVCAPSSSIDDRALAMIAGDSSASDPTPAGPYMESKPRQRLLRTAAASQPLPIGQADPRRTQERVLRIVFQPYIDGQGRLHEASAVHAVVQSDEWQQQVLASSTAIPDRNARATPAAPVSLAEAVDQADPANGAVAAIDPNLPDPAVVAAARARAADPVGSIKSEVAARLAPKAGRTPPAAVGAPAAQVKATDHRPVGAAAPASRLQATDRVGVPSSTAAEAAPVLPPRTGVGAEAAASARQAEETARAAAATAPLPGSKPVVSGTVRAASFPAAVPEEH